VDVNRKTLVVAILMVVAATGVGFAVQRIVDGLSEERVIPFERRTPFKLIAPEAEGLKIIKNGDTWSVTGKADYDAVVKREGTGPGREFVPSSPEALALILARDHGLPTNDPAMVFSRETGWTPLAVRTATGEKGYINEEDLRFRRDQQVVNAHGKLLGYFSACVGYETPQQYEARRQAQPTPSTC
jgi:hypothetical protein